MLCVRGQRVADIDVPAPAEATVAHHRRKAMYDVVVGCGVSCLAALEEIGATTKALVAMGRQGE